MNTERWGRVYELFDAAGKLAPADRRAFLDRACGEAASGLRDEVLDLLSQHDAASRDGFLEPPFPPGLDPEPPPALADHPRYRVLKKLGEGGMGTVYLAEHRVMERFVALKVIRPDVAARADLVERFGREVKAAAKLSDRNIVTVHDAEQVGDTQMLVMEYVEGTDLARWVKDHGPMPVPEACEAVRQVALGLQHAFERGMVHRDIKPQNLMRTPEGLVKILDFGIARVVSEVGIHGRLTGVQAILGTADYIAPEQVRDPQKADIRADIYSLGCTLHALLTGHSPCSTTSLARDPAPHGGDTPRPLAGLPAGLDAILRRMMAKDPAERYQTPIEVARALAPFANGATPGDHASIRPQGGPEYTVPRPPIGESVPVARPRWRWPGILGIALGAVLLGIGILNSGIVWRKPGRPGPVPKTDGKPLPDSIRQRAVVAEVEKLRGIVLLYEGVPGRPVFEVDLSNTGASDATLKYLAGLTGLQSLNLMSTAAGDEGLRHLRGNTNLQFLNLHRTAVTDAGLEHLCGLTNLRVLLLNGPRFGDEGLVWVERMESLANLDLSGTLITDAGLARVRKLPALLRLDLGGTRIGDASLRHLEKMPHLRWLSLYQTRVTDAGVGDLQRALPGVEITR